MQGAPGTEMLSRRGELRSGHTELLSGDRKNFGAHRTLFFGSCLVHFWSFLLIFDTMQMFIFDPGIDTHKVSSIFVGFGPFS